MAKKNIGRSRNVSDTAKLSPAIPLNSLTSTKIADANEDRIFFQVENNFSEKQVWIKLQAASVDDEKKGIFLHKNVQGIGSWEMTPDNFYTGEISAIAEDGNPLVYITEY